MSELSGGQQQRVAIAQAIVDDAELLLLDEPLANLDLRNQQEIVRLLGDLHRERDVTIMVVAHDLNPLLPVLTEAIYLLDGHPHHDPIADVVQEELLTHLYGTPVGVVRTAQGDLFTRAAWRDARTAPRQRPTLAPAVEFQSTGWRSCRARFMRNALIGGSMVAIAAGLLGYFVITRQNAFAAHALAHIGFPGATGAILVGAPVTLGLAVFCVGGGLLIGLLGQPGGRPGGGDRHDPRPGHRARRPLRLAGQRQRQDDDVGAVRQPAGDLQRPAVVYGVFTAAVVLTLAVLARPLVFASVDPAVAEARGVPVRALGIAFVVLLALTITMAVQVVGTLLLFALVVTPAATALRLTARPTRVAALAVALAARRGVGRAGARGDGRPAAELLHRRRSPCSPGSSSWP